MIEEKLTAEQMALREYCYACGQPDPWVFNEEYQWMQCKSCGCFKID